MRFALTRRTMRFELLFLCVVGCFAALISFGRAQSTDGANSKPGGTKPGISIDSRVRILEEEVKGITQRSAAIQAKVPGLNRNVTDLLEKTYSVERPQSRKPDEPKKEEKLVPRTVYYRPPLSTQSKKKTRVAFICREGKVFVLDFDAMNAALNAAGPLMAGRLYPVNSGDYDVTVVRVFPEQLEAVLKPNRDGESIERIEKGNSTFTSFLAKGDSRNDILQFVVFPDSFDVFRSARTAAWTRSFDVGWNPIEAGGKVTIGGGAATAQ